MPPTLRQELDISRIVNFCGNAKMSCSAEIAGELGDVGSIPYYTGSQ